MHNKKKYLVVKIETLQKLMECFSDREDFQEFMADFSDMVSEVMFLRELAARRADNKEIVTTLIAGMLLHITMFARDNLDTIHDLTRNVDYKFLDEDEREEVSGEPGIFDFDSLLGLDDTDLV